MEDFPSNSQGDRTKPTPEPKKRPADAKKVEAVVKGEVIRRKKPLGKRFKETFFGGNARGAVAYATMEVLLPATKDMVFDFGRETLERIIFGEGRGRGGRGGWRAANTIGHVPYNRYAQTAPWQRQEPRRDVSPRARSLHEFDEIILESRGEAEEVIDQLMEILREYGQTTVSDLYALVNISSSYTDQKYGWTDLRGASVSHVRGGTYLLNLPKPVPLD